MENLDNFKIESSFEWTMSVPIINVKIMVTMKLNIIRYYSMR